MTVENVANTAPNTAPTTRVRKAKGGAGPQSLLLTSEQRNNLDRQRTIIAHCHASLSPRTDPCFIGIRARSKTRGTDVDTGAVGERPTMIAMRDLVGSANTIEVVSAQEEIDFLLGMRPTSWRALSPEEAAQPNTLLVLPHQIRAVKPREAKRLLGADAFNALPKQDEYMLVPASYEGFRPDLGDELLIPNGGLGDMIAMAGYGAAKGLGCPNTVRRCTPAFLKAQRELAGEGAAPTKKRGRPSSAVKDEDHLLLAGLLEETDLRPHLPPMTERDMNLLAVVAAFRHWEELQLARKIAEQHYHVRRGIKAYMWATDGLHATDIQAVHEDALPAHVVAAQSAEADAKKELDTLLQKVDFHREVLSQHPQVGPSLAARVITAIGGIERFVKNGYDPRREKAKLGPEIHARLVSLGLRHPEGGANKAAFNEALQVKREDLLAANNGELSDLTHMRSHMYYDERHPRCGQINTFHVLNVLVFKWSREADAKKTQLAQETLALMKRYNRFKRETALMEEGEVTLQELQMRRTVAAVQKFCGVFVDADGRFPQHRRGQLGGWNPIARQAMYLFGGQANKDCSLKDMTFGPLRQALALLRFEYHRRHPEQVETKRDGRKFVRFTPKGTLRASSWKFAALFIDWIVRSWIAFNAGQRPIPYFFEKINADGDASYPPEMLKIIFSMKWGPDHLTWTKGQPIPPPVNKAVDEDGEEEAETPTDAN